MTRNSIYVHSPNELPDGEHWAIIEGTSVHVPAEGVWAPGHGYPEHTDHYITYQAFTNQQEFETELKARIESNAKYGGFSSRSIKGIHVQGVYQATTEIKLTEPK